MTVKILLPFRWPAKLVAEIEQVVKEFDATLVVLPDEPDQAARDAFILRELVEAEVVVSGYLTPAQFAAAEKLKWIHVHFAGVNRLLSVPELVESQVTVTNAVGVSALAIADQIMGYVLGFSRLLPEQLRYQQRKTWRSSYGQDLPLKELAGSTLGIIGYGKIGTETAKRAKAFGMKIIATKHNLEGEYPDVDQMLHASALDQLLAESDYVVLCAPLTPETEGMLGRTQFEQMKPSAYFINIARGQLVKEMELTEILRERCIAGAALDVFEVEPLPAESPLWDLENVIITPHSSGNFENFLNRTTTLFADNLRRYLSGQPLFNIVDKKRGY